MSDVKYDTGLTDDDFTVRKLKQWKIFIVKICCLSKY